MKVNAPFLERIKAACVNQTHMMVDDAEAVTLDEWGTMGRPCMWARASAIVLDELKELEAVAYYDHAYGGLAVDYDGHIYYGKDSIEFKDAILKFENGDTEPRWFNRVW